MNYAEKTNILLIYYIAVKPLSCGNEAYLELAYRFYEKGYDPYYITRLGNAMMARDYRRTWPALDEIAAYLRKYDKLYEDGIRLRKMIGNV